MKMSAELRSKAKGLLFGLNYVRPKDAETNMTLGGCVRDAQNMAEFLRGSMGIPCEVCTDGPDTTKAGLVRKLTDLAAQCQKEQLRFVWIHYSGHGVSMRDMNGDETDRRDEAIVPTDWDTEGVLLDDHISSLLKRFPAFTKIVVVFDCCHSGTIGDLMYSYEGNRMSVENRAGNTAARIMTLSGCLDSQTAEEDVDGVDANSGDPLMVGAMTKRLLQILRSKPAARTSAAILVSSLRADLKTAGFPQIPKLCSSYDLRLDATLIPALV